MRRRGYEVTKKPETRRGFAPDWLAGARGYSDVIGKMLFTQDSAELQKLCPYLHVVSLLRDQIPGRARNPDNSSFDPVPVGSTVPPTLPP